MIEITTPIENGLDPMAPYSHAAIRKLTIDTKDQQIHIVLGFGDGSNGMVFSELAPMRRFTIRNNQLRESPLAWELPEYYYASLLSGVAGPILDVLEQRLIASEVVQGKVV